MYPIFRFLNSPLPVRTLTREIATRVGPTGTGLRDPDETPLVKPNAHRRRDETVELRRVGVGGVYMNSQLTHDDCRRIR